MASLATTPGNRLVIPLSSSIGTTGSAFTRSTRFRSRSIRRRFPAAVVSPMAFTSSGSGYPSLNSITRPPFSRVITNDSPPSVPGLRCCRASASMAHLPVVHLRRHDDVLAESGLVRLRTEPRDACFAGDAGGTDDHLRCTREHVGAVGELGLRCLGCQRDVAERIDVVDVHRGRRDFWLIDTGCEAVDVQLGVADLDGPDTPITPDLLSCCRHRAHHVATLIGRTRVRVDVVETEGVGGGPPGERRRRGSRVRSRPADRRTATRGR